MAASCHLFRLPLPRSPTAATRLRHLPTRETWAPLPPAPMLLSAGAAANPWAGVVAFSSGYNVQVTAAEDEPEEVLLRRFRREVTRAGVIQECKRRRFFENKQEERKRKAREAGRRNRRRRSGPRSGPPSSASDSSSKKAVEDDDNWDMPEGDLPY